MKYTGLQYEQSALQLMAGSLGLEHSNRPDAVGGGPADAPPPRPAVSPDLLQRLQLLLLLAEKRGDIPDTSEIDVKHISNHEGNTHDDTGFGQAGLAHADPMI